jgi:iron complex transport system substrate-binding protein
MKFLQCMIAFMLMVVFPLSACAPARENAPETSNAERIVSGFYISTSALIALGLDEKLVGIEARADTRPIYALAAPNLLTLPNVGTARDFNLEACLALEPDLVILPARLRDAAEIMTEMGVNVILVEPENPEKLMEMTSLIGHAAGASDRAEALVAYYKHSLNEINGLTANIQEKPLVYMGGVGTYLSTAPRDMYQSYLIEMAGGINVAGEIEGVSRIEVSYEQLLAMNPQVIVIPPEAGYGKEEIISDTQLALVDAVQNGRIYQMPERFEAWDSPVPSFTLGIRWLLSVLHEDIYPMAQMRDYAAAFYSDFYGIEINPALIGR